MTPEQTGDDGFKAVAERLAAYVGHLEATIERQAAEIARKDAALCAVELDCVTTMLNYERNGPSFTSPAGDEYEPSGFVQDKLQEILEHVRPAIKALEDTNG